MQENLKLYRASVLKASVEGRLVPTEAALARAEGQDYEPASALLNRVLAERRPRGKEHSKRMKTKGSEPKRSQRPSQYDEHTSPRTSIEWPLPEGWCWATIDQLASDMPRSIQSGPFGSSLLHSEFQPTGRLVIGIDNVKDGFFSMGEEHRISPTKYKLLEKFRARPGDVLITVMATIGRCCVVPESLEPAIITKHVYRITPEKALVLSRYLQLAIWGAPMVREQIFGKAQGQTRLGLNGTIIKNLIVPLPPPIEQSRIVAEAERLLSLRDATLRALRETVTDSARLRQSILKHAFEGKLVDQDPTDEPASDLLARIRAERASSPQPRQRQSKARR